MCVNSFDFSAYHILRPSAMATTLYNVNPDTEHTISSKTNKILSKGVKVETDKYLPDILSQSLRPFDKDVPGHWV